MKRILVLLALFVLVLPLCGCISSDRGISFGDSDYDVGFQIDRIVYTPTYDDYAAKGGYTYAVVIFTMTNNGDKDANTHPSHILYAVGDNEYEYHELTYAEDNPIEEKDLGKGESLDATIVYEIRDGDAGTQGELVYE